MGFFDRFKSKDKKPERKTQKTDYALMFAAKLVEGEASDAIEIFKKWASEVDDGSAGAEFMYAGIIVTATNKEQDKDLLEEFYQKAGDAPSTSSNPDVRKVLKEFARGILDLNK